MAPVMPFISERIYQTLKGGKESVHLESWPESYDVEHESIATMKVVREVVSLGLMKRTEHKLNVKQPLSSVTFKQAIPTEYHELILDELNVKKIIHDASQSDDVVLDTHITEALQKEGDIRKLIRAIQDMRKVKGLQPQDEISVIISSSEGVSGNVLLSATCKIKEIREDKNVLGEEVELSDGIRKVLIA
jgi:isoleucyl-tRNA synthetase